MHKSADHISQEGICHFLSSELAAQLTLEIFDSLPSTNDYLKNTTFEKNELWHVCIAREQTAGKGRRGKTFLSPPDSGIYMSINQPAQENTSAEFYMAISSLAVAQTLNELSDECFFVKWPNDVYCRGKKVCGILCESLYTQTGALERAIIGIGINVYKPLEGIPIELQSKVTYVSDIHIPDFKNRIIAGVITQLKTLEGKDWSELVTQYRDMSLLDGRDVSITEELGSHTTGLVLGVNDDLSLRVQLRNGEVKNLLAGDVSIMI